MKRMFLKWKGFTLIELLVVITIITILAGLTLSMISYAQRKATMDRARGEISGLESALESYKADNGDYPRNTNSDLLNAQTSLNATIAANKYQASSLYLYKALSGDSDANRILSKTEKANGRTYFTFKPSMLYPLCPVGGTQLAVQAISDPFKNVYGYSTIGSAATTGTPALGFNPTFDLWCTVDPQKTGTTSNLTWITNW